MDAGEAGIGVNLWRLMSWIAGGSWMELFFRRAGGEQKEWVMRPDRPSPAARCVGCGGVWLSLPKT
jgi:hypothetical protein